MVRELADEVLVYDLARDKAYCLNPIAGAVWKHSDGQTSAGQIAERVSLQLGATVEEQAVWTAIEQLGRDHLLEYCISAPGGVTRREHLKSFGKAAAIAGPMVAALAVPKGAAGAQSCIPNNKPCNPVGIPCCKG
ncbi:MAG TPA: PqqD family peptide modification chaperone, partial [Bryobacteraceae bacterium]|nr:PqqD family peptide modification chaperone [Bryobacteraceae bacterium]